MEHNILNVYLYYCVETYNKAGVLENILNFDLSGPCRCVDFKGSHPQYSWPVDLFKQISHLEI